MEDPWGIGGFRGGGEKVPNEQIEKKNISVQKSVKNLNCF